MDGKVKYVGLEIEVTYFFDTDIICNSPTGNDPFDDDYKDPNWN